MSNYVLSVQKANTQCKFLRAGDGRARGTRDRVLPVYHGRGKKLSMGVDIFIFNDDVCFGRAVRTCILYCRRSPREDILCRCKPCTVFV
jgi:hypothetical protein